LSRFSGCDDKQTPYKTKGLQKIVYARKPGIHGNVSLGIAAGKDLVERPQQTADLLNDVPRTEVTRIQRLPASKPFVLAMVEAYTVFPEPPAQVDFFVVDQSRKVE
jgi:hypothetical protein